MTLLAIAGTSFALGLSGAIMPGPLLTVTIAESLRRGPWAGPMLVAGHALLEAAVVLLLYFGLGEVVQAPPVFAGIALVGGALLLWLAAGMLKGLPRLSLQLGVGEGAGLHPLAAGVAVSLANPYFLLWWATVGLGYLVVASRVGLAGVAVFYLFHILSDLAWYALVSNATCFGRRFLSDRGYRGLVGGCALFLLLFGGYFFYLGGKTLAG